MPLTLRAARPPRQPARPGIGAAPAGLFADFIGEDKPERVAANIYGISLLVPSTLLLVLWRYAVHARLVRPDAADEDIQLLTQRLTPGLAGYLVLIVVGLSAPLVAAVGYLAIALFFILPIRLHDVIRLRRRRRQQQ